MNLPGLSWAYLQVIVWKQQTNFYVSNLTRLTLIIAEDYFDMDAVGSTIQAGYHTTIKVQAMEVVPSQDLQTLSYEERGCRFKHEIEDLELFSSYSQSACEFEYRLKSAEEVCRCTPWYYPSKLDKLRYKVCDLNGNYCFKTAMYQIEEVPEKTCLPLCHQLQFTSTTELIKSNAQKICSMRGKEYQIANELLQNGFSTKYYQYRQFLRNNSYKLDYHLNPETMIQDVCKALVDQDIARVSVMFASNRYVRTTTNIRVTFLDMVSSFGILITLLILNYFYKICLFNNQILYRWNIGLVHRNEHFEHD